MKEIERNGECIMKEIQLLKFITFEIERKEKLYFNTGIVQVVVQRQ